MVILADQIHKPVIGLDSIATAARRLIGANQEDGALIRCLNAVSLWSLGTQDTVESFVGEAEELPRQGSLAAAAGAPHVDDGQSGSRQWGGNCRSNKSAGIVL